MGGAGARRHRPRHAAGQRHGRVRRLQHLGLPRAGLGRPRGLPPHGHDPERPVGPAGLPVRAGGPGGHGRHGVLVVAGGDAPGLAGAAVRRLRHGPGRRRVGHGQPLPLRRLRPPAGPGARRPLQGVLGGRRRRRLLGRRRHARDGAALRRPAPRPSGVGGGAGFGGEPGRGEQRVDGAERAVAGAGDPSGVGERGVGAGRRRRGGGARHRHPVGGPDRGPGAAGHLRAGPHDRPAPHRFGEVEHRPHRRRRRRGRRDQGGRGHAPRHPAGDVARGRAVAARGLVGGRRGVGDRGAAVGGGGAASSGGGVVVRDQWDERARDRRGGAGGCAGRRAGVAGVAGGAVVGVGSVRGGGGRSGVAARGPCGRAP